VADIAATLLSHPRVQLRRKQCEMLTSVVIYLGSILQSICGAKLRLRIRMVCSQRQALDSSLILFYNWIRCTSRIHRNVTMLALL
jgi:hypothetical protein